MSIHPDRQRVEIHSYASQEKHESAATSTEVELARNPITTGTHSTLTLLPYILLVSWGSGSFEIAGKYIFEC